MGRIYCMYIFLLLGGGYIEAQFTCDPVTDCASAAEGSKVPDPEDCYSYYLCTAELDPTPTSFQCDAGQYFDSDTGTCVDGTVCNPDGCASSNTCTTKCSSGVSLIPYPGDCSKYYRCSDQINPVGSCPTEAPYFNGAGCVGSASECCINCETECDQDFETALDPANCNGYFFCGIGANDCPDGQYFNPVSYQCEEETTPCNSYCPDGIPATEDPVDETTPPDVTIEPQPTTLSGTCVENPVCTSTDDVAYCNECIDTYYDCATGQPVLQTCSDTFVFDYTTGFCVPEENCPYFPQ